MPYPDQTRYVARACAALGYSFTDLDNGGGALFAVSDGRHRFVSGAGKICAYPLNTAAAHEISKDKAHTNAVLARAGIEVIPSKLYFLTQTHAKLREPGRDRADAVRAFEAAGTPLFCKPNAGSQGAFAEIVADAGAFRDYLARVEVRYDAILLQPIVEGDEYRVFCIDGEAIFAAQRSNFAIVGDGAHDLKALLENENARLAGTGVSAIPVAAALDQLHDRGLAASHVAAPGERIELTGRRNLSAGSDVLDFSTDVPAPLASIATEAAAAIGLRVAGVDIFDTSPARDLSRLVVIEINGNPAISSLERIGRDDVIDRIWHKVLRTWFAEQAPR